MLSVGSVPSPRNSHVKLLVAGSLPPCTVASKVALYCWMAAGAKYSVV
jgi:hypothetical protein